MTGTYRIDGTKCVTGATDCAYIVLAWYKIVCAKSAATCSFPESIKIDYAVKQFNYNTGTTPMATVETGDGLTRATSEVPYSSIRSMKYGSTDCKTLYPTDINMQYPIGYDSSGRVICGKDPNQDTIDSTAYELCKVRAQQAWVSGGTVTTQTQSQAASGTSAVSGVCDSVTVDKFFPLSNAPAKTTEDCLNQQGEIFDSNNNNVTNSFRSNVGGRVTWKGTVYSTDATQANFKTTFGITTSTPTFVCKKAGAGPLVTVDADTSRSITLPSDLFPNTLVATVVGGGGGGHGSGGITNGCYNADGGCAGQKVIQNFTGAPNAVCTVSIGGGGGGGGTSQDAGGGGGATTFGCSAGASTVTASGGNAGGSWCAYGGNSGSSGAASPITGVYISSNGACNAGAGAGANYGAGGQGGMSDNMGTFGCKCGNHSGGSGGSGFVRVTYKQSVYSNFTPL